MKAYVIIHHFYRLLLDFIYPNRCGFCDCHIPYYDYFCKTCSMRFSPPPTPQRKIDHIDEFTAVTVYDSFSRPLIAKMKRENNGYALAAAAFLIYRALLENGMAEDFDIIAYIPMRKKDLQSRGYNQSKIIVKELSWLTDKPWVSALEKVKDTKSQKSLKMAERKENVKDVFACRSDKIKGKTVLLIDDVCTTGSTLSEAARVLKQSGAAGVNAAVVAKTRNLLEKRKRI